MDFLFRHLAKFIIGSWILAILFLFGIVYVAIHFLAKVW